MVSTAVTFAVMASVGVGLHLNLPATRRLLATQLTTVVGTRIRGTVVIEQVGRWGFGGASGVRVRVLDPGKRQVLFVDGLGFRTSFVEAAWSALFGTGEVVLDIRELGIDYADASVDADAEGTLQMERAFTLQETTPSMPRGRSLAVAVRQARVAHAWVHGQIRGAPPLDADVDEQEGRVLVTSESTRIDVDRSQVRARGSPRGANPRGDAEAHLVIPSPTGAAFALVAGFAGEVGPIPLTANASLDGARLDVVADVRLARAEDVRAFVPEAPVYADLALHAEAHGDLSRVEISGDAEVGSGTVALDGELLLDGPKRARIALRARGIDVRAFSPGAPASALGADLEAFLAAPATGGLRGEFDLDVVRGEIAGQAVPPASFQGSFTEATVRGEGDIAEPGAPTHVSFEVRAEHGSSVARVIAATSIARLDAVPRIGPVGRGRANLQLVGKVDLDNARLDARLQGQIDDASRGSVRVGHAALDARIGGTFEAPVVDAALRAEDVLAANFSFDEVTATAVGPLTAPQLTAVLDGGAAGDRSHIEARATIQIGESTLVRGARASLARGGETAVATVDTIRISGRRITVDGGTLEGLGDPAHASVRVLPTEIAVAADAKDLDLARLGRLARAERYVRAGHLGFDVDLVIHAKQATGSVVVDLVGGRFGDIQADAHLDAKLMDRRVFANVAATAPGLGHLYLNTSTVALGGALFDAASWSQAYGKVQIDLEADLEKVAALLPDAVLPVGELQGRLTVEGEVGRDDARDGPEFDLSIRTKGLVVAARPEPVARAGGIDVVHVPRWRTAAIDIALDAGVDSQTGRAHLEARVLDQHGLLVGVVFHAELPYDELLAHPEAALVRLESVPFEARIWVPRRALAQLPSALETQRMTGTVELSAEVKGTVLEPRIGLVARTTRPRGARSSVIVPTDAEVTAQYDGKSADARLAVRTPEGEVLSATTRVHLRATDILDPPPNELPWDASVLVRFARFPLHSVTRISDMQVKGHITGEIGVAGLHEDARAQARIRIDDLRVGGARYTGGFVNASLDGQALDGSLRLEQEDGFAETRAKVGTRWGKELAPTMDDSKGARLSVEARGFRAAALLPFVGGTLSELDGRIDADAQIDLGPHNERVAMRGSARLSQGLFELPMMGGEFRDAKATVTLSPSGIIRVDDASATGVTGRILASGVARLDGLRISGARAAVRVPKSGPIPLSVEGEALGEVWGDVTLDAKVAADQRTVNLVVDIPELHARIPEVQRHTLQPLEADETIRVGVRQVPGQITLVRLGPPVPEPRPGEALRWTVQLHLGNNVEVERGSMMRVQIEGNPVLTITDRTRMSGQLRLRGGFIVVQGKKFEIEKGTITFMGDPDNPILVVTAGWTAPDGTRVYADFAGPLKTGKVSLRSEPHLPRNEILSLIVFGAQGQNQSPPPGQQPTGSSQAVGLGGGIASQGVNRAMEDLTGLDLTARVDTSDAANPHPELELQIAKDISLQIAYVLGTPSPGENPDKSLLTLDWRFYRNWSLETTVGDRGSSIFDLLWRRRY